MAYKEQKLAPGEAVGLFDLWNAGFDGGGKKKAASKATPAKPAKPAKPKKATK